MNRPTRFYLALHATLAVALAGAMALHLAPIPPHWPALAQRPTWTVWVLIGLWLALSAAGVALRPLPLWRVALGAAGAALLALGLSGLALGTALAGSLLAGLGACALACAALAAVMAPARIHAPRAATRAAGAAGAFVNAAQADSTPIRAPWWQRMAAWPHWPFVVVAALALESFRLGHIVAAGAARPSGMAGLLVAFFLALPAATLRHWWPRWAAALWLLAGAAYVGLAHKSGLPQVAVAAALCLWQPMWAMGKTVAARTSLGTARHRGQTPNPRPGTESTA